MFKSSSSVVPETTAASLLQSKGGAQGKGQEVGGSRQRPSKSPGPLVVTAGWPDPEVKHGR